MSNHNNNHNNNHKNHKNNHGDNYKNDRENTSLFNLPAEESYEAPITGDLSTEELHHIKNLPGMYKNWFLEYASYVILERAVPDVYDGLKPVQRRILHAMKRLDDGRYNKVANIIGFTMQYHPHGDASIGDALVSMGQKDLMIDTQGNWGNIYTGDGAAAPRYIEARLSKFALDVAFNPKTTVWKLSYDGRNKEPVHLPVKFPLLLAQGAEGIAVGLASKILPHNFCELLDASIAHLKGESFELLPDFPTGGMADCSKYNDGLQGGRVRVRARISRLDKKTLVITEIPFGKNTTSLIETILAAAEKGKIKIKKIDDNTAENVEILVHLAPGVSPDQTIDGLYAFTDCEISISTNCCVIQEGKPRFLGVTEMLKISVANTVNLLKKELQIKREELSEEWHKSSLEKIFIEKKIYNRIEKCETWEAIIETIDKGLDPYKHLLRRAVTHDDIVGLTELKIKRISRYDSFKADEHIKAIEAELKEVDHHLAHLIDYAIAYYQRIKEKYAAGKERKTQIRNFDIIEAAKVVAINEKLYVNRKEGFVGTSLKKDEFVAECSDIDDIIVFLKDGRYLVTKVADKIFVGLDIIHVGIFKKNDDRTIYNVIYQDGKNGSAMIKRFAVTGVTRDKEYHVGKSTPDSRILYLTANPNGEAEIVRVNLKPQPRLRKPQFEVDFSKIAIKGRGSMGNILSRRPVSKVILKEDGISTLGGRNIWFDHDVSRLNADGRGQYIGEFSGDDKIAAITKSGNFRLHGFDLTTHFEADVLIVEKFDPEKIYTAVYFDGEQQYYYLKRFNIEPTEKLISFIGDHPESRLATISGDDLPRLMIKYKSTRKKNVEEILDAAEFIAVKGCKARGRRISTTPIESIELLEPVIKEEEFTEVTEVATGEITGEIPEQEIDETPDEIQKSLFDLPVPKN